MIEKILKQQKPEAPALFKYEVEGVNAIKWDQYPNIFKIGKNEIQLQSVEDALPDARALIQAIE